MNDPKDKQLAALLKIAEKGFRLVPTIEKSPNKTLGSKWEEKASSDPATIRKWFKHWPKANWGILIGGDTGKFALDVDGPSHGEDKNAVPLWMEISKGKKVSTVSWVSFSGDGYAYIFQKPPGVKLRTKIGGLIEVRGANGYAQQVLPIDPKRFIKDFKTKVADIPLWLMPHIIDNGIPDQAPAEHRQLPGPMLDVEAYLRYHNLEFTAREKSDGVYYTFKKCPLNDLGHDEDGTTALIQYPSGGILFKCHHAKCDDNDWQAFNKRFSSMGFWTTPRQLSDEQVQESRAGRFHLHTLAEANEPQPPVEWIVTGVVAARTTNIIYGQPGAKKTYVELVKAVCIAAGIPFLNRDVVQGPVLIIDEESGHVRMKRRLREVALGLGVGFDLPLYFISLAGVNLGAKKLDDRTILEVMFEEIKPTYCFIDALADVTDGDENSKEYIHPVFQFLRSLAEKHGTAFDIIHHSGKSGDYRGSSAMFGAVDTQTKVVVDEDDPSLIKFDMEKNRDAEPSKYGATASWVDDEGEPVFKLEPRDLTQDEMTDKGKGIGKGKKIASPARDYVLLYLYENPNATMKDLMDNVEGCSAGSAKNALITLISEGHVQRYESKRRKFAKKGESYVTFDLNKRTREEVSKRGKF